MTPHPRRLDQILTGAPVAASLLARIARARAAGDIIAAACAEVAPAFDPTRPGACDLQDRVLRLWPRSGAQCTKLRQTAPRLLELLQRRGLEVIEIRVGVQPGRLPVRVAAEGRNNAAKAKVCLLYTSPSPRD